MLRLDPGEDRIHTTRRFAVWQSTPDVAWSAFEAARRHETIVSYAVNPSESLWRSAGGQARAQEVNRDLVRLVDVLFGKEEDLSAALGSAVQGPVWSVTPGAPENRADVAGK